MLPAGTLTEAGSAVATANDISRLIGEKGSHCLIIARHGETEWNAQGRMQGQQDSRLSQRGRRQTMFAAQYFHDIPLQEIHCSTLQRSRHTAEPIAKNNTGQPEVLSSELLNEIALGYLEGELKAQQSSADLTRQYQEFSRDEVCYRIPGGENLLDVADRVRQFFAGQLQLRRGQGTYLIVGHRNVNKMIISYLLGLTLPQGCRLEHEHQQVYFYFCDPREMWSCQLGDTPGLFEAFKSTGT